MVVILMMMKMKRAERVCAAAVMMTSATMLAGVPTGHAATITADNLACSDRQTTWDLVTVAVTEGDAAFTRAVSPYVRDGKCTFLPKGTQGTVMRTGLLGLACFAPSGMSECLWTVDELISR